VTRPKYGISLTKTGEEKNRRKVYERGGLVIEYTKGMPAEDGFPHPGVYAWRIFQRDLCGQVDRTRALYAALDFDDVKLWLAWNHSK
jgi:hypothetical protein